MRALLLQNCATEDFGWYQEWLANEGHVCRLIRVHEGQGLPSPEGVDAVFVGGTRHAAASFCADARFRREWIFLRAALRAGRACFGIGCGGRVLARLLGGRVRPLPRPQVGRQVVSLTPEGAADPLFDGLPGQMPVLQWHRDTFEMPPGAACLATSNGGGYAAFRRGAVAGVLFHLEVSASGVGAWADAYASELREAGIRREALLRDVGEIELAMRGHAFRVVRNFTAIVERRLAEPLTSRMLRGA
jgi:GMP synthase-like glutamine amidotransferase